MQIQFTTSARAYVAATQALAWHAKFMSDDYLYELRDLADSVGENCLPGSDRVGLDMDETALLAVRLACRSRADELRVKLMRDNPSKAPFAFAVAEIAAYVEFVTDASQAIFERRTAA